MRIDLHVHSSLSPDGYDSIGALAAAARRAGLDGIGVCDHNRLGRGKGRVGGVLVLYGEEVSTRQGHVLVYGVRRAFQKGMDAFELVEEVRKEGGVTIVAHPFSLWRSSLGGLAFDVRADALEKFNGSALLGNAIGAVRIPVGTGGSDAHAAFEVGGAYTVMECEAEEDEVLECIRKGRLSAVWRPNPINRLRRLALRFGVRL